MADENNDKFMARAIELSRKAAIIDSSGGAFGTVIVKDGEIIGEGRNCVVAENDPTWHGEIEAIRNACRDQGTFNLEGATLYTSAEPCPMCLGATYWAGIKTVYYAANVEDALKYGNFDDSMIYDEIRKPMDQRSMKLTQIMRPEAVEVWKEYAAKTDKIQY
ncbi:MAG: nucleoside deaminase [Sphingomicrobium sp.]